MCEAITAGYFLIDNHFRCLWASCTRISQSISNDHWIWNLYLRFVYSTTLVYVDRAIPIFYGFNIVLITDSKSKYLQFPVKICSCCRHTRSKYQNAYPGMDLTMGTLNPIRHGVLDQRLDLGGTLCPPSFSGL